jgi:oligopeptide/dipeptide ABC transporter ATP-binding protein
MYLGRIVEQASASVVFDDPQHPYTQGLLAASPTTEAGRLSPTLGGEPPSGIGDVEGCPFVGRCPTAIERCQHSRPELRPSATGGVVACHVAP